MTKLPPNQLTACTDPDINFLVDCAEAADKLHRDAWFARPTGGSRRWGAAEIYAARDQASRTWARINKLIGKTPTARAFDDERKRRAAEENRVDRLRDELCHDKHGAPLSTLFQILNAASSEAFDEVYKAMSRAVQSIRYSIPEPMLGEIADILRRFPPPPGPEELAEESAAE